MKKPDTTRLEKAKQELMKRLPLEKIRQIPKYRNYKMEQYLQLIDNISDMAIILLESYIFTENNTI